MEAAEATVSPAVFWSEPDEGEPYQSVVLARGEPVEPSLQDIFDLGIAFICEGCTALRGQRVLHYKFDNPHGGTS